MASGPLDGVRVVELAGLGPGPWACMALSDMGAEVLRVDRPSSVGVLRTDLGAAGGRQPAFVNDRGRSSVAIDLKHADGVAAVLDLVERADVLIEGNRPGVAERLGIGPDVCLARNPRLVYGRATGWGQDGPLSQEVGHDLNYLAVSGLLSAIGRPGEPPTIPLNIMGDYAGGGALLAFGVTAALFEARGSGLGQVVDSAMLDGISLLGGVFFGQVQAGMHRPERGVNMLDGGAPFYAVYETSDGGYMAVGALEAAFFAELLAVLGLDAGLVARQWDRDEWPRLREAFAEAFGRLPRSEWERRFAGREACVSPVLGLEEAIVAPHATARGAFVEVDGVLQPAPAPRLGRTPGRVQGPAAPAGANTREALLSWGFDDAAVARLRENGAIV